METVYSQAPSSLPRTSSRSKRHSPQTAFRLDVGIFRGAQARRTEEPMGYVSFMVPFNRVTILEAKQTMPVLSDKHGGALACRILTNGRQ